MGASHGSEASLPEADAAPVAEASGHGHTSEALTAEVYGEEFGDEPDEYLDLHDKWVSATAGWSFEEIRDVLWKEALDYHFLGGSGPIAGWCRCGDHGDRIESFLHAYGIGVDIEGEFYLLDEDNPDDELSHRGAVTLREQIQTTTGGVREVEKSGIAVGLVEQEVHLIARPAIDWDGLADYLGSVDEKAADWLRERMTSGTGSDGENVIEAAHRACDRFWDPGPNPDITKISADRIDYLHMIVRSELGEALEHATYTFAFRNISHVTADALMHHRAGTVVSRQRRPLLPDPEIPFWLPDWARNDQVLLEAIEAHLAREGEFQNWLREHIDFHDSGKSWTHKKMKAVFTRWFLPQGATTDVFWTANIRGLREVIGVMTAHDAEEPSRSIFAKVREIMEAECPVLFGPRRKTA